MDDGLVRDRLHARLLDARAAVLWKLDGLPERDIRRPMTPTGTNLLGLVKHLTITEAWYLGEAFGRPFPLGGLPWHPDDADDAKVTAMFEHKLAQDDMWARPDESRTDVVDRYRRTCAHADATIAALAVDAPGFVAWWPRPHVTLLDVLVHVLAETTRHAGHADILREQIDGAVGAAEGGAELHGTDPFWVEHRAKVERAAAAAPEGGA